MPDVNNLLPQKERVNRDFQRKNVMSYFLPYGILNHTSLNSILPHAADYATIYDPERALSELADKCQRKWIVNNNQISVMEFSCYIEDKVFSTSEDDVKLRDYYLTPASLSLLAGVIDWNVEYGRQEQSQRKQQKDWQQKKIVDFTPSRETEGILAKLNLLRSMKDSSIEQGELYEQALCDAVCCWDVTMLGVAPELIGGVNLTGYYNAEQRSRAGRLANVLMMFRQNQYLTYLDRRPLDTKWAINNVNNKKDFEKCLSEGRYDLPALTSHCLRNWYEKFPDSYLFSDPGKLLSENYEEWLSTPVFYSLHEIPGYLKSADETGAKGSAAKDKKNSLRSTAIGVGIGAYVNYIIYHMTKGKFRWVFGIEKNATKNICDTMQRANQENSIPGFDRTPEHAIMFFETVYQFESIFVDLLKPDSNRHRPGHIPSPFIRMFLVPINSSGIQQFRMLMEFTPYEFIRTIIGDICEIENTYAQSHGIQPRIFATNDPDYPLSYNNKPVLFAYDLEIRRLRQALLSYQLGKQFYVACYPEQVKFIKRIMPNVEFI